MTNQTQMKHTPGPWTVEKTKGSGLRIQSHEKIICWLSPLKQYEGLKNEEVNARLISAAPELLETCKITLDQLELAGYDDGNTKQILKQAIAKAESGVPKETKKC